MPLIINFMATTTILLCITVSKKRLSCLIYDFKYQQIQNDNLHEYNIAMRSYNNGFLVIILYYD